MTTPHYDVGDRRKLCAEIRDEDGALADPTAVTFLLLDPTGAVTVYVYGTDAELVKDSVGLYHVYWDIAAAGVHVWRIEATGVVAAAEEARFYARAPGVEGTGS